MKLLKKIKYGVMTLGMSLMMLPTKVFAFRREEADLYGAPEDYNYIANNTINNTVNTVKESSTSFEPDSMFLIRCLTFFLVPLIFIIGLLIYAKKSKSEKATKIIVTVFLTMIVIAMLTGAILFVVGSVLGWF